jgi:hypothetical protein
MDAGVLVAERLACTRCIGDDRLRADARSSGFVAECAYCEREGTCVDVAWLADRVHPAILAAFAPADAEASTPRLDGAGAAAAAAGLDAALAGDVHRTLVALFHDADGTALYPPTREYVERPARDLPALHRWESFVDAVARARPGADDALLEATKWAFARLDELATPKGRRALSVLESGTPAFAVRLDAGLVVREDEPLHATHGGSGPLNGPGTPALYLGLRERTAVTESLAPRGAHVVVTRVRLARAVRLLDLETACKALARAGCLDADRAGSRLRARFLDGFVAALRTSAVRAPDDPASRATQRVGDWLAHGVSPRVDGLLARAAHAPGRTLALFAPAATTGAVVVERERRYSVAALRARYRRVSSSGQRTRDPRMPPARD